MWNYYRTVYASGNLEKVADYFDGLEGNDSFWVRKNKIYDCHWEHESTLYEGEEKGKCLCLSFENKGYGHMEVRVFATSSHQLVVECYHAYLVRLLLAVIFFFFPMMICIVSSGGFPMFFPLVSFFLGKVGIHVFFKICQHRFKEDLKKILPDEPISSQASWKLLP